MAFDDLRRLNIEIGRAEKDHAVTSLERILHERLVFRRASGKIVGKQEYLGALPNTTYTVLESTDVEEMHEGNEVAVWAVNVRAKGLTADGNFSGIFRNVRMFVLQDERWQLLAWANTKIRELEG